MKPTESGALSRGVITVAFGSARYINMATNLAISVRQNWPGTPICLVTDSDDSALTQQFDVVVRMDERIGRNLLQKLNLDRYSPFAETLFLDSDCLVVRDMSFVWPMFAGSDFSVVGSQATEGQWFGAEIAEVRRALDIAGGVPKFNGGLMYWKKGTPAASVFATARELAARYEDLGFESFRPGLPQADEPLISLAMALHGHGALAEAGSSMATPIGIVGRMSVDVRSGYCSFTKGSARVAPAAPHFCGPFARGPVYRREAFKLQAMAKSGRGAWSARVADLLFLPATLFDHSVIWNAMQRVRRTFLRLRARRA